MQYNKFILFYIYNTILTKEFVKNASVQEIITANEIIKRLKNTNSEVCFDLNFLKYLEDYINKNEDEQLKVFWKDLIEKYKDKTIDNLSEFLDKESTDIANLKQIYIEYNEKIANLTKEFAEFSFSQTEKNLVYDLLKDIKNENEQVKVLFAEFLIELKKEEPQTLFD